MNGFKLNSTIVTHIYFALLSGGYIWATYYPKAPFLAYATQITIGFGVYITKRLIQKKKEYNGKPEEHIGE